MEKLVKSIFASLYQDNSTVPYREQFIVIAGTLLFIFSILTLLLVMIL
jgi:hypothetical protein